MRYLTGILIITVCCVFCGCGKIGQQNYSGGSFGGAAIPGDYTKGYNFVFQCKETKPLFAIFWIKTYGAPSNSKTDSRGLIIEINGHPITPSLSKKTVYALQPDYSLKEVALTNEEIDHLFKVDEEHKDSLAHDKLFQTKIVPNLKIVDK
ncbi:MAG: hypothetical protein WC481_06830 [Candidatus Omnitrophota bacterium]